MKSPLFLSLTLSCLMVVGCQRHSVSQESVAPEAHAQSVQTPPKKTVPPPVNSPAKPMLPVAPAEPVAPTAPPVKVTPIAKPSSIGARVSRVPSAGACVALTFDDGPCALTNKALDILSRHGARGTFFVLGQNAARNPSILARAAAEGHEIGVHTWSHIKMSGSSREKIDSEVSRTMNTIAAATGKRPVVMRPPYGATNADIVQHMYRDFGMRSILWDVDTVDWRHPGVQKVINTAVNQAKPGSIILVHDIHASTLTALEGIVTGLQKRGFKLVTVSELIARGSSGAPSQPVVPAVPIAPAAPADEPAVVPAVTPAEEPAVVPVTLPVEAPSSEPDTEPAPAPASVPASEPAVASASAPAVTSSPEPMASETSVSLTVPTAPHEEEAPATPQLPAAADESLSL